MTGQSKSQHGQGNRRGMKRPAAAMQTQPAEAAAASAITFTDEPFSLGGFVQRLLVRANLQMTPGVGECVLATACSGPLGSKSESEGECYYEHLSWTYPRATWYY